MAESRFFIDAELAIGASVPLPKDVAHHARHVLRLRDGHPVVLFNGLGGEFKGTLEHRGSQVVLESHDAVERESPLSVTLVQSWIAADKLDWVVEKCVELGVARILLVPARRSVVRLDADRVIRRIHRLRDVAIAACCQCGRNRVPPIGAASDLGEALGRTPPGSVALMLHPDAEQLLVDVANAAKNPVVVAVGPEGGFDSSELLVAERAGYRPIRLGPRVLRTETAGLAAVAALQASAGDFR